MRRTALLVALSLLVALALAELGLRAAGFSFDVAPESVEFGWPDPRTIERIYLPDPDLFWVPRDYFGTLAELAGAPADIVFLGDSCTEFGAYPRMFLERVREAHPGRELSGVKLGVGGWSTHQGLAQLERDVVGLRPRFATFYYGWNDHWIGFGIEDAEIRGMRPATLPALGSPRLFQLVFKARVALRSRMGGEPPTRVPLADFRANLAEMVRVSRGHGIVPVFLTAPTSHRTGHEPAYLSRRYLRDLSELVPLHRRYAEVVRQVARETGTVLCDLAADFAALPEEDVRDRYFRSDGIHPTRAGDAVIAERLEACFEEHAELRGLWGGA